MVNLGPHPPMTYAEFERMLTRLGFTKTERAEEQAFIFRQNSSSAFLVIPSGVLEQQVHDSDLLTARFTLLQMGIVKDLNEYATAVQRAVRGNRMAISRKAQGKASGAATENDSLVAGG